MLRFKISLILFLNIICFCVFSQGEFIIKIDRETGVFEKVSPALPDVTYIYPNDVAYDEDARVFYFPSALKNHALQGVKVSDGSVLSKPNIDKLWYFQYDNVAKKLYGIEQDNNNDSKNFVAIDPVTAQIQRLGNPIPGSGLYSAAYSAFDTKNHIYIFIGSYLYSINAADGKIIYQAQLATALGENVIHISFDNSTSTLYGLLKVSDTKNYFLVKINQKNGVCTKIGAGIIEAFGNGNSTIDEARQQFIYYYSNANGYYIATLDLKNGEVIYNKQVPLDNGIINSPLDTKDNVFSLKYDNKHDRLYSISWDAKITDDFSNDPDLFTRVFPNPAFESATVEFSNPKQKKMTFTLFDSRGRLVQKIKNLTTDYINIQRANLVSGVYLYQIYFDWDFITTGKLVFY